MAAGDKAIYRDSLGSFDLDKGSFTGVPFNTQVVEEAPFTQNANDIDVDLADAGHYLIGYSLLGTGGAARLAFQARLTLGGSPIAYGRGHCTARNASQDNPAIHGSTILVATAGQDVRVEVFEMSTNTNTTPLDADKSGLWLLKLDDTWSYARLREVGGGQAFDSTTFTDVDWDTDDELDTADFTRAGAADELTLDTTGHYLVCYGVTLTTGTSSTRTQHLSRVALNGTPVEASYSGAYMRGNNGTNEGVLSGMVIISATANDVLTIQVARETGASTTNFANECALTVVKLPDTGEYLRVHESGGGQESNPSSPTIIVFDTEDEEDTASFVHDAATGRATVQKTDDYLFTYGSQETAGGARAQMWKEWHVGGTIQQWGGVGNYNRGSTQWSGSSTGSIFSLTASDIVDMRHTQKGDTSSKLLVADRYGMTAVNLGTLFGAVDFPMDAAPGSYAVTGGPNTAPLYGAFLNAELAAYALSGLSANLDRGYPLDAGPGSYGITGLDATPLHDALLDAALGAYAVTGPSAELLAGILLDAGPGVYALSGLGATLARGFLLVLDPGAYATTGLDATPLADRLLDAAAGAYALSGLAATLLADYLVDAGPGAYVITGLDAELVYITIGAFTLIADPGSYAVSGLLAEVLADRLLPGGAVAGAYSVSGLAATLAGGFPLNAEPGAYALAGLPATPLVGWLLSADPAIYTVSGAAASLIRGILLSLDPGVYLVVGLDVELLYPIPVTTGNVTVSVRRGGLVVAQRKGRRDTKVRREG